MIRLILSFASMQHMGADYSEDLKKEVWTIGSRAGKKDSSRERRCSSRGWFGGGFHSALRIQKADLAKTFFAGWEQLAVTFRVCPVVSSSLSQYPESFEGHIRAALLFAVQCSKRLYNARNWIDGCAFGLSGQSLYFSIIKFKNHKQNG